MIIVKNRELLIPNHERYIGTPIDNYADNRIFQIKRFSQSGEDLSGLTFRLDLKYPAERTVYTFTRSTTHTGGAVSVLSKAFVKAYPNAGTYTFSFNGTEWKHGSNAVDLEEIGVVINFTSVSGDTITVVSTISNVSGNVVLLEKEIGENEINLIWHITENDTAIPGTVFVALRGSDGDAMVRYASYYAALYVDANLDQTALPASGITELEQLENMTADQLRKMEYLYNRYKDLDVAAQDAEAWAKGTRNGYPVPTVDDTYQNNAKYYSDLREEATHLAEAWARGTRDGVDLPEGEIGYHDNAKHWKTVSEGWAHGGTGTHTNEQTDNSKYWSEISHAYANQVSYKKVYANVSEMVADTELIDGQVVRTLGYNAVNDGGGALYRIYSSTPSTRYETLANGLNAELIVENRTVTPNLFGAYGDGTHDDSAAVRAALKYSIDKGMKLLLIGKYYITGSLLTRSDYSSAKLNVEGVRDPKEGTYLVRDTGIIFSNGLNLFDGLTLSGSISRVTFTPLSRTQTGSIFKNCILSGLVFQENTVANILAVCHNSNIYAVCKFNENHFLSVMYFAKCDSTSNAYSCIDSYICKNYINGDGSPESHCFEFNNFSNSTISENFIDYFQTIYYPKANSSSSFIGPNSIGNTFQVFRYFYVKTDNITIMFINSASDNFSIMNAEALDGIPSYAATKEKMENYAVYQYKNTLDGVEYIDDLKPYIMFVDYRSIISIKNAVIGLYTKNLVYLAKAITDYVYAKAELSLNIYSNTTYRDYDNCVQHCSVGFYNGGVYKFNTIDIPFIKEYAELPTVSNFAQSDYYLGEKIKVGNKIYRLYAKEESWLHPAWFDISALV